MKAHSDNKKKGTHRSLLQVIYLVLLFGQHHTAYCQEKPIISAGVGLPELVNIGIRIPLDQIQIGVSVGGILFYEDLTAFSFSSDIRRYFGSSNFLFKDDPIYGEIGFNFLIHEDKYTINEHVFLNTRIGFELNLTQRFGAEVDFGVLFELHQMETKKSHQSNWNFDIINIPVLPAFSASIFYRL